jgi:integrase
MAQLLFLGPQVGFSVFMRRRPERPPGLLPPLFAPFADGRHFGSAFPHASGSLTSPNSLCPPESHRRGATRYHDRASIGVSYGSVEIYYVRCKRCGHEIEMKARCFFQSGVERAKQIFATNNVKNVGLCQESWQELSAVLANDCGRPFGINRRSCQLLCQPTHGRRIRTKKEKTLGPASMPKHEAQEKLADYITEYTGRLTKQGASISTFGELWKAFCAVKSAQWSKKTKENLQCLFGKYVVPVIGQQAPREVTLTSLQLLLNKMAEDGYRKSAVGQVRTYLKSCFDYATDEDLIPKSPARKLAMPNIQKKSSERFLSLDEFRSLLSQASPREHLVLRILAVCGLRPAEVLVLRIEDFEGTQLRIDEALKERQKGDARIGDTKTDESDNFVPVPPDLEREVRAWISTHPNSNDPRAFLFPSSAGSAFSVGNYLKRYLKPLAEKAGVPEPHCAAYICALARLVPIARRRNEFHLYENEQAGWLDSERNNRPWRAGARPHRDLSRQLLSAY